MQWALGIAVLIVILWSTLQVCGLLQDVRYAVSTFVDQFLQTAGRTLPWVIGQRVVHQAVNLFSLMFDRNPTKDMGSPSLDDIFAEGGNQFEGTAGKSNHVQGPEWAMGPLLLLLGRMMNRRGRA